MRSTPCGAPEHRVSALLDALEARRGLVCFVDAGGKKTTFYRLAAEHRGRVGISATVHIPFFPKSVQAHPIIADEEALLPALLEASSRHEKVIFACPSDKHGRYAGIATSLVSAAHARAGFDVTLVKADGARSRWIKAPNESEPRIPPDADTVVCVVSAQAIGQPLSDRIAHRVERIEAICGARGGRAHWRTARRAPARERGGRAARSRGGSGDPGHQHGRRRGAPQARPAGSGARPRRHRPIRPRRAHLDAA